MSESLKGQQVLFIAPKFFGYESEIKNELIKRGAEVDYILDRPFTSALLKLLVRIKRDLIIERLDRYYEQQLSALSSRKYSLVFVISGQTLSLKTLKRLKELHPQAKFVLYMWDSFKNRPWALKNLPEFDACYSFDRNDAAAYKLHFRPLFFSAGFEKEPVAEPKYDVSFIGTIHTDRYAVWDRVRRQVNDGRSYWYLFLQSKPVFYVYKLINAHLREAKISEFKFAPLAKAEVQRVFQDSKAILDIEHPQQTGLTMRTLESVGARKKLITTNAGIKDYDFYNSQNICIIDRRNPLVPESFLATPYADIEPQIYNKYRIQTWLDDILS